MHRHSPAGRVLLTASGTAALIAAVAATTLTGCGGSSSDNSNNGLPNGRATLSQVQQGRQVVTSSACADCHGQGLNDPSSPTWLAGYLTSEGGNGPGIFQLGPFTVYAANITPDTTNGIGKYTDRQIYNALKHGLDPASTPDVVITGDTPGQGNFPSQPHYLAPIMPWGSWRHKSDSDLWAIVAYLKHGIKANSNAVPDGTAPPDFWASSVTASQIGPVDFPAYPATSEVFSP